MKLKAPASEADGLLADVLADPADNTPRLIYADWLADRNLPGDAEEADLIRFQISGYVPPMCFHIGCAEWLDGDVFEKALGRRADDTCPASDWLNVARRRVNSTLPKYVTSKGRWNVNRGFVSCVGLPYLSLIKYLPALLGKHPLSEVEATDKKPWRRDPGRFTWWNAEHGCLITDGVGPGRYRGDSQWSDEPPYSPYDVVDADPDNLIREHWLALTGKVSANNNSLKAYETEGAAVDDFSAALLLCAHRARTKNAKDPL